MQQENTIISHSEEETAVVARKLAARLHSGDVVLLHGDLGAGKSIFARALIQTLCGEETIVPSPTFTLVQTYEAPEFTLWHFDLYRLNAPEEVYELGIEEALRCGVCLIEWPDRLGPHLPKIYREIELQYGSQPHERLIIFKK
ncbi:MAG: tRNA (adenosine(37)-N6)-threonylcarbamoyltransferase complex ATPase subunit type 1 TsaE [Alphaproteobacteria bacterium]|nr:tRNA (adenosine(37)-N6)-threonylcarbamoyltransferase complex ATPase subunit type 1 TsaE [Alphaproteobacteria bacterium]